jgi:hypothetical protein
MSTQIQVGDAGQHWEEITDYRQTQATQMPRRQSSHSGMQLDHQHRPASQAPSPIAGVSLGSSGSSDPSRLDTNQPPNPVAIESSPSTPYFELIGGIPSTQQRQDEASLCVAQQDQPSSRLRIPRHLVLPLTIPDESPMSRTYTDYVLGARRMLESGVPPSDVLGPTDRIAVDLFFRPRQANDRFDCASWACEVSRSYDTDVAVRLATACLLTFMMRVSDLTQSCASAPLC